MPVLSAARVVTPGGVLEPGWLSYEGALITAVGHGAPPSDRGEVEPLPDVTLVPGFIDLHCHGGGGHWFTTGEAEEVAAAAAFHLANGTTTMLASGITCAPADLPRVVSAIGELAGDESSPVLGSHLEGPWISVIRCGAHDTALIRPPSLEEWRALDREHIRMVTYAPELDLDGRFANALREDGAINAVGHSDATYEIGATAIEAGAAVGTHLFNAMPPLAHRDPGLVAACLEAAICELIVDRHHVADAMTRIAFAAAPGRVALITDAIGVAGSGDGTYPFGPIEIEVSHGLARVAGTIAGSTLTMAAAVRNAVALGVPLEDVVAASSAVPARALGLEDRGELRAGLRADLVALDATMSVTRVWRGGMSHAVLSQG